MEKYENIDGLRAYSAIGILMMHVYIQGQYHVEIKALDWVVCRFTDLVFLFMIISSFSMCCGYFNQITENRINLNQFYSRRFKKIWPFFAMLSLFELMLSPSKETIYELFANLTLCFGFLPNNQISVIGVGWTLGVIMVFYLLFPFVCYLLMKKQRAWLAFFVAVIFHLICDEYFFDSNHVLDCFNNRANFIYCAMFFIAGGLIYLYRESLKQLVANKRALLVCVITSLCVLVYMYDAEEWSLLLLFSVVLIYALGDYKYTLLKNKIVYALSRISFEIYLCHFAILRVLLKSGVVNRFMGKGFFSYITLVIITLLGASMVAIFAQKVFCFFENQISIKRGKIT